MAALIAWAALSAGCGVDKTATTPPPSTVPDKPPTPQELAQIRSTPKVPLFWLGPSYGARKLTRATFTATDPPDLIFQYGEPSCRVNAGCSYDLGVATVLERDPDTTQGCWRTLGPAIVLGCDTAPALQIYSGPVEVFLSSRTAKPVQVVRALRLKRPGSTPGPRLDGLAAPKRFTCEEAKGFPPDFRAGVPAGLAPAACPGS